MVNKIVLTGRPWRCELGDSGNPYKRINTCTLPLLIGTNFIVIGIQHIHYFRETVVTVRNTNQFFIEPNTLKWTLSVAQWPFMNPANSLTVQVSLSPSEPIWESRTIPSPQEVVTRHVFLSQHAEFRASIPQLVVVDNTLLQNTKDLYKFETKLASKRTLEFSFPSFVKSLEYDPDFSVLLRPPPSNNVSDVGATPLVPMVAGAVAGGVAFIAMIVTSVLLVRYRVMLNQKEEQWKNVSF